MNMQKEEDNGNIVFKCLAEFKESEISFEVKLDDSLYITPHSYFNEKIFNLFGRNEKLKNEL